jgi:5-(carboxyamino)imidazole ribonucleotide mutase
MLSIGGAENAACFAYPHHLLAKPPSGPGTPSFFAPSLREWIDTAVPSGLTVIIAAVGMAAHLAGAFAVPMMIPVIGIPVVGGSLSGLDALLATVNMPAGVPVAIVGLGGTGARNAGLFAAQILGLADAGIVEHVAALRAVDADAVRAKEKQVPAEYTAKSRTCRDAISLTNMSNDDKPLILDLYSTARV